MNRPTTLPPVRTWQSITSSIAVNYRVDSNMVDELYKNIGMDYETS